MTGITAVRAMLVERHPVVRAGMATVLGTAQIRVVAESADAASMIRVIRRWKPNVIVADLENGLTIAGAEATPPVMVLSFRPAEVLIAAIRGGVRGVIGARSTPGQLVAAVNLVAAGGVALSLDAIRDLTGAGGNSHDELGSLTARERQLLDLMALGMPNAEIGQRLGVSPKTVRNVVSVVQRKLGTGTRAEAIEVGRESGLGRPKHDHGDPLSWLDGRSPG